jgi:mycofactocin precursor
MFCSRCMEDEKRQEGRLGMEDREKDLDRSQRENEEDAIFKTEEIKVEEMAIDGICGVY